MDVTAFHRNREHYSGARRARVRDVVHHRHGAGAYLCDDKPSIGVTQFDGSTIDGVGRPLIRTVRPKNRSSAIYAVSGCLPVMPNDFPVGRAENSGNMIHARAPLEMYTGAVTPSGGWESSGELSFRNFVNRHCDALIMTFANTLRVGDTDGSRYARIQKMLESYDVPIVVFGLGAQSDSGDLEGRTMPVEAVEFMRFLGDRCAPVGVRGDFTARVFEHFAGVTNTYVTGCPSFFSRPDAFGRLRDHERAGRPGRVSYAGTAFHRETEKRMLEQAIHADTFLVEPVNKFNHEFFTAVSRGEDVQVPWFLAGAVKSGALTFHQIAQYYRSNYRLFRDTESWYRFNEEVVSYTYGTRFHVNMASMLSGRSAVWVTHDTRTRELCDMLHLPRIPVEAAAHLAPEEFSTLAATDEMFDHLPALFEHFNTYLDAHSLPRIPTPT